MELLFKYFAYVLVYFVPVILLNIAWKWRNEIRIIILTANRDLTFAYTTFVKMLVPWMGKFIRNETLAKSLDKIANRCPRDVCFLYENEKWTYEHVQSMSFQVANFFQAEGYRTGDVVGLAMQNRPEVICIWLGLSRLGVTTALINFHLKGDSLRHCITAAECKSVIFGCEMREAFKGIWPKLREQGGQSEVCFYELDRYLDKLYPLSHKISIPPSGPMSLGLEQSVDFETMDFSECLRKTSSRPTKLEPGHDTPKYLQTFLYIFTSGTTGVPKAARSSHGRLNMLGYVKYMLDLTTNDVCYCPLPLYHTFALTGTIWAIAHGIPLVIIPKFSASKFWSDIHFYKVTVCLYMGELCRFIVNQPPQPELETNHRLVSMFGCGVKPEVWETFVKRFKVRKFMEAYGSTEGNCTLVNMEGTKIGAFGYIPLWMQPVYSVTVIKIDEVTGEIIRDEKTGRAIVCKNNEAGELVGRIVNFFPSLRYDGYTNKEANEKKTARDLFRKGDRYFRTGDIVTKDDYGYFYFKDRIGDTFRWKGENVSTAEVEGLILRLTKMKTTVVYGVKIPGTEGRAGMATIVDLDGDLDLSLLGEGLNQGLPSYARPLFIRICRDDGIKMTGTFKLQKFNLQTEGFDIGQVHDPIFFYRSSLQQYQKLDIETFQQIMAGNYRF